MKKLLYTILFVIIASPIFAQNGLFSMQYSMGFSTGDLHSYIKPVSFRGFTMDYRKFATENVGIGFDLSWNVFYEEMPYDTYNYKSIDYSGKQYRYSNHFPMLLGADYYFNQGMEFSPFAGLGIGTMYTLRNTDMNLYTFETDAWQFSLRPEIGFIIEPAPGVGLLICSKYYYGFKTKDMNAQGFATINVGIVLKQ